MSAPRLSRCAVGCALLVLIFLLPTFSGRTAAQQLLTATTEESRPRIAALAERLAVQLLAAHKKRPFVLDLTLPGENPCPLGEWLADKISDSLAQTHPELEVIPRSLGRAAPSNSELLHDSNQENAAKESRAHSLGAEVLVRGNFAAIPTGIGITLMANDRLMGGDSRFEALAELPLTPQMQARLVSALPERVSVQGSYRAGMAGIGSAICDLCPAPEYPYVAQAQKLSGVVIVQVRVSSLGVAENSQIIRAPNPALGHAAIRALRNWRFKPATNASGEFVPVVVDVAVRFHLNPKRFKASALNKKSYRSY